MSELSAAQIKPKQAMTSIDIAATVRELRKLEGCLVRSVLMPTRDVLTLELACDNDVRYLVAEGGRRLHLTRSIFTSESVKTVRPFRKAIEGSKLVEVSQLGLERVVSLRFGRASRSYGIYVEVLPRGIIALVDEGGKIIAINKRLSAKDRVVSVGFEYVPPPALPNIMELDPPKITELIKSFEGTMAQLFIRALGVPPELVNDVLSERERSIRLPQAGVDEPLSVVHKVRRFIKEVIERPRPCVVLLSETPIGFYPFVPSRLPEGARVVEYGSMNDVLDEYFRRLDELSLREVELSKIRGSEAAIEKTLKEAEENIERISERLEEVAKALDLIERSYYEIETIWSCCRRVVKEKGWGFVAECGTVTGDPDRGAVRVQLPDGAIELLLYKDVNQQYGELRKEYAHLSDKLARAKETVRELRGRLEELANRRRSLESVRVRPRRTAWFTRFLWIETSGGFLAIGGRDASQNELLVRKHLGPKDIFMHADVHGASALVILARGRTVPESDLREVACLAASYSKAWKAGLSSVDVFWVWGEQVGLSAPPGEYLPKGSFMVYGQKNFIRDVRVELGIGVAYVGDSYDLIIGPPELVKSRSAASVTIVPGADSVDEVAKQIRDYLVERCPEVRGLTTRDVAKLIPGKARIVDKS